MIDKIFMIVYQVVNWMTFAIASVANLRDAVLLRSEHYESVDEEKKGDVVTERDLLTNASYYINKINSYVPGLGHVIDYMFSPNICLVIMAIAAAASFFSPLGLGVGIASVVLLSCATIAGVMLSGVAQREIDIKKQTTSIVKSLEKDIDDIETSLGALKVMNAKKGLNFDVERLLKDSVYGRLSDLAFQKPDSQKYSAFDAAISGIAMRFPVNGFMFATGIATLNPLVIGLTVTSVVLGEAAVIRQDQTLSKINADFDEEMSIAKSKLGLPEVSGEQGLKDYAEILSEVKRTKFALARFQKDYESILDGMALRGIQPSEENLRDIFAKEYLASQPRVNIPTHVLSYGESLATCINNGWTWSDSMNAKSPFVEEYAWAYSDNAYKYNAIEQAVKAKKEESSEDAEDIADEACRIIKEFAAIRVGGSNKLSLEAKEIQKVIEPKAVDINNMLAQYAKPTAQNDYSNIKNIIKERENRGTMMFVKRPIGG